VSDETDHDQAGGAKKQDPAETFLDWSLGRWSSHPKFAVARLRKTQRLALGIGLLVFIIVAWHLNRMCRGQWQMGDLTSFLPALRNRQIWTLGLTFAFSAALTAALTIRASIVKGVEAKPQKARFAWVAGLVCFLGIFVVCAALAWLARPGYLALKQRVLLMLAGIIPLHGLLWWFSVNPRSVARDQITGRKLLSSLRRTLVVGLVVACALVALGEVAAPVSRLVMSWTYTFLIYLTALGKPAFLQPLIVWLKITITVHMVSSVTVYLFQLVGAIVAILITLGVLATIDRELCRYAKAVAESGMPKIPPRSRARTSRPKSLWRRIWEWLRLLFGYPPPTDPVAFEGPSEEWAGRLEERLNRLRAAAQAAPDVRVRWIPGPMSGESGGGRKMRNWRWVFGNRAPSASQEDCFHRFQQVWFSAQLQSYTSFASPNRHRLEIARHADLFIESVGPRAGLTTLLHACAIYAAAARGQRVLILVSRDEEKDEQRRILEQVVAEAEFHHLVHVGGLSDAEVYSYCGPRARVDYQKDRLPPEILVATPDEYDAALLDSKFDDSSIRSLLLSIEVILIDGLDRMIERRDLRWLVHLPFLLDKHRLALSSEGRVGQVVFGGSPLSEDSPAANTPSVARQRLALRLFGGDGSMRERFLRLRRFEDPPIDALEITIGGTAREDEALRTLLAEIRAVVPDEKVGLFCPGDDRQPVLPGVERFQPQDLLSAGVVLDTEFFARKQMRWLVVPGGISDEDRAGLYQRLNQGQPEGLVLLAFVCPGQPGRRQGQPLKFPVFVSAEASALMVAHLFSILPVLRVDAPIRREKFARFGLNWDPRRLVQHSRGGRIGHAEVSVDWEIEWDGDLGDLLRIAASDGPWPAVFVRRDLAATWKGTGMRWPVDEGICLDFDDQRQSIRKALARVARIHARYATWVSPRGLILHTCDLFLQDRFVLELVEETPTHSHLKRFRPIKISPYREKVAGQPGGTPESISTDDSSRQAGKHTSCGVLIELQEDPGDAEGQPEIPDVVTKVDLHGPLSMDGPYRVTAVPGKESWQELVFRWVPSAGSGPITSTEWFRGLVSADGCAKLPASGIIEYGVETSVSVVVLGGKYVEHWVRDGEGSGIDPLEKFLRARFAGIWQTGKWMGEDAEPRFQFWPLLSECVQVAVQGCAPQLQKFCRIFAFHPVAAPGGEPAVEAEFEAEKAVLLILENPTTVGTALEVIRTLLDDAGFRRQLLDRLRARLDKILEEQAARPRVSEFVGPKEFDEDLRYSAGKVRDLLGCMGGGLVVPGGDHEEEPKPRPEIAPPPAALPPLPFEGQAICGKCGADYRVKIGHDACYSKCSKCGAMLYYLKSGIDHSIRYPMQFTTRLPWPGSEACRHPRLSKERLLDIWRDLARTVRYEYDKTIHAGRDEVWQCGEETLHLKQGDCEDHAILLLDWLVSEGYEARVALGDVTGTSFGDGGGGHAWVVLRLDGVEYHMEATAKNAEPLAPVRDVQSVWPDHAYVADYQFDHADFWSLKPKPEPRESGLLKGLFASGDGPVSFWDETAWERGLFLREFTNSPPATAPDPPPAPVARSS
jgi:hypothetical protein